ncbi:tetratricopeptide repeat protein [Streptomyces sp. NBC_01336]|uniref:tetratricopeptide repeat protein n=1 Tax=Streptomyces sp. NBC_01336 TaxID=2903829 RepID=UPI002E12DF38|nr:tetratricopeptide repeat protein [Streptomyces sp. NBC_01336]
MHEERAAANAALAELRHRLSDALADRGLTKTQVAAQTRLGRTTVQLAFQEGAPDPPSAATVAALARVLHVPEKELLELRRRAAAEPVPGAEGGPGRPIGKWNPLDLEVHPAGPTPKGQGPSGATARLPGYVARHHDRVLAQAVQDVAQGHSRIVVLVGTSSTGKTRACWEAVQPLAVEGWRLWHPFDPTRADAALEDLKRVQPRTVVWLNEAQHYLGDPRAGERIAASVHTLLTHPDRTPVLVLGTLWPEYDHQYTALPSPGQPDPHSRVRELLAGRTLTIPDSFDEEALRTASALAKDGDGLLADTLTRAGTHGQVTQDLAGAPELLRRYERGTPAARAVAEAAMDARRLGLGLHLPQTFLTDAAIDYLSDYDYEDLSDDWAEAAFAELARPVHGKQALLRRTTARPQHRPPGTPAPSATPAAPIGPAFRLADYLEQHGRTTRSWLCPPASFWHAAHTHLTHPDDLNNLANAAHFRHRLQWAHHLRQRAVKTGSATALISLAGMREEVGDRAGAEALYRQAADAGNTHALYRLANVRRRAGDRDGAEALYRQAADSGDVDALVHLADMLERAGDRAGAEALYRRATDLGNADALVHLADSRESAGDQAGAEAFYRQAADNGNTGAMYRIADMLERTGDREGAEALYRQAADNGNVSALYRLVHRLKRAGGQAGAEALYRQAADNGNTGAMYRIADMLERTGDREGAEALYRQAADSGDVDALVHLADSRENAGDRDGAEALYRQAADSGNVDALVHLADMLERAGDRGGAETLYRQAADTGNTLEFGGRNWQDRWWLYGLDPDGTPSKPWAMGDVLPSLPSPGDSG